jgi:non-canonical poly(A) RNA polymerase PAPD5/7
LPEERLGEDGVAKFRDVEQLSDDDELDMDISSSSEAEGPSKKRARTTNDDDASGDAAPKWSNPDPYTALPCPDESTRKKKNMVELIRKARIEEQEAKAAATTEAEDFISFDLTEDEDSSEEEEEAPPPPPNAPSGPRADLDKPRAPVNEVMEARRLANDGLGSRKRTADDVIKPPDYGQLKKATTKPSKGVLLPSWQPKATEDPCPWDTVDHSATTNMGFR